MIARQRSTCASDEQHAARINAAENTVRKKIFFLELALNFRTRTHLNGVKLREHTYNASTIFQYSGWCLAVLKMCNNLKKKLTRRYFLTLLTCCALNTWKWRKVRAVSRVRTEAPRRALNFQQSPYLLSVSPSFCRPFSIFTVHDSLLSYTAIFQLSTAQERGVRGN